MGATQEASSSLPVSVAARGISPAQWNTLCRSLYPGANPNSVVLVWDYCVARQLDPLKKPCHIVPMQVKDARTNKYEWRDVVMPGIYEYRTTAQRTGEYMGTSKPEYGPVAKFGSVSAPEWCSLTAYRWNAKSSQRVEFPVTVHFSEVVATKGDNSPNARWTKAPIQMLTKCAEAAALRAAFPDEFGGELTAEEMADRVIDEAKPVSGKVLPEKPEGFDNWLADLEVVADEGLPALEAAWAASKNEFRMFLNLTDSGGWEALKSKAETSKNAAVSE